MSNRFASNKRALAMCDVCGFEYRLKQLKNLVVKNTETQIKACPECWGPSQPQLMLGTFPVDDPQAIRNPRPDQSIVPAGDFSSINIQWGWARRPLWAYTRQFTSYRRSRPSYSNYKLGD
jgi:hypothetical protein